MSALAVAIVAVVATTAIVASASAITIKAGNIEVTFDGSISPTKFPRKEKAPLTLQLKGKLKTTDGTHLSAAKTINLEFDKAGELFTKGLPSCRSGQIQSTITQQAKKVCGDALIGTGVVTADIALPEQAPFGASGPLLIFNASKGNKQELLLHVYAHVPAPTTFVVPVKISKAHGKFGTKAVINVPSIVGGNGSVTSFKAKLGKKWTYKGKKVSLLNASCPTGSLFVRGELSFANGTKMHGEFSKPCTPTK